MNSFEKQYSDVLSHCLKKGEKVIGRNGKQGKYRALKLKQILMKVSQL